MKITHFVENLNRGGLERVVINLAVEQKRAGHECQIICLFDKGSLAEELDAHGIAVESCDKQTGADLRCLIRLRRFLRQHGTEVLHTHNMIPHYHAVLAGLGLPLRRVINTRHGMGALRASSRREWFYRRCMPWTDVVVTVCEKAREDIIARRMLPPDKLVVVPNGIHIDRFAPTTREARRALTDHLELPPGTRLIGSVGRLNWAKDLVTLLRAFAQVAARFDDTVLLLIGDGGERQKLIDAASEMGVAARVRFLGDRGDVAQLLQGLHLYAMSSISEGYSIALLEACASGLPIVTTDVGGNAEIVHDQVNGRIVPARDADAMAAAMIDLLAAPERAEAMGRNGRAWVVEQGTVHRMAARYDALYTGPRPG
ncbi:MAG TPA: glycosyltransferase [Dokdonella sp.]